MKSRLLSTILLMAVLAVLLSGQYSNARPNVVQTAAAAPGGPENPMATVSGYISVSAAAFQPEEGGYSFNNSPQGLWPLVLGSDYFIAPVSLPQGAKIVGLACAMWDSNSLADGYCNLAARSFPNMADYPMATINTSGYNNHIVKYETTTITNDLVDNSSRTYYMEVKLRADSIVSPGKISFYGAIIQYQFNALYLPTVSRQ